MRVNLGAAFAHLFKGENNATVTIKASENIIELFHKEDEKSLFPICKKSAKYADGWRYCTRCHTFFTIDYAICPNDGIKLRNSPRKKKGSPTYFRRLFKASSTRLTTAFIFSSEKRRKETSLL